MYKPIQSAVGTGVAPPVPWESIGLTGWVLTGCCMSLLAHWMFTVMLQTCFWMLTRSERHHDTVKSIPVLITPIAWVLIETAVILGLCGNVLMNAAARQIPPVVFNHQMNVCIGLSIIGTAGVFLLRCCGVVLMFANIEGSHSGVLTCLARSCGSGCVCLTCKTDYAGLALQDEVARSPAQAKSAV